MRFMLSVITDISDAEVTHALRDMAVSGETALGARV